MHTPVASAPPPNMLRSSPCFSSGIFIFDIYFCLEMFQQWCENRHRQGLSYQLGYLMGRELSEPLSSNQKLKLTHKSIYFCPSSEHSLCVHLYHMEVGLCSATASPPRNRMLEVNPNYTLKLLTVLRPLSVCPSLHPSLIKTILFSPTIRLILFCLYWPSVFGIIVIQINKQGTVYGFVFVK